MKKGQSQIELACLQTGNRYKIRTPRRAAKFISRFDEDKKLAKPFNMVVRLPGM